MGLGSFYQLGEAVAARLKEEKGVDATLGPGSPGSCGLYGTARIARLLGVSTSTIYNFLEKQLPGSEFIRHNLRYTNSKSNEH